MDSHPGASSAGTTPQPSALKSVTVEFEAIPVLSYAMAHNQVPFLHRVSLTHLGAPLRDVVLAIEVSDADGRVSRPYERRIDELGDGTTTFDDLGVRLDPAAMLQVDEQRPGTVRATVRVGDETVGQGESAIQLLAARQWLYLVQRPTLSLELLAAHVMPNDPAVTALMREVATHLEATTGSASIQGYQADAERVDKIVQSVFEVVQRRRIAYSSPPASWGDRGQKVRTPTEVLDGGVGTCLDTVVVLAAALEQAGIRPLLWVVEGHAFLGYWRYERALDAIAQTDVADVVNLIDLGLVGLVETTMVTSSDDPKPFADAHRPPYVTYLTGDLGRVEGVVDVWAARHNDVLPLPARRTTDEGVQVVEYTPAVHSTAPAIQAAAAADEARTARETGPVAPPRVRQWKNSLLDLSLRNRLINFSDRAAVSITVPEGRLGTIEDLVHARGIQLLPSDAIDDVHLARGVKSAAELPADLLAEALTSKAAVWTGQIGGGYQTRMRGLAYKARTIVEETGANNLYLALGSLVWEVDGKPLRSPLVLVPVNLVSRSKQLVYRLELDESGTSTPNFCLLEKLRQLHGLVIPGLAEPTEDERGIDLDAAMQAVRVAIAQAGLRFRVEPTADLSILQFAKFRLWKDLDEHWSTLIQNPLVQHLVHTPTDPFVDPAPPMGAVDLDELDAACPVPADASQLEAIAEAVAGQTFVLEGPPGTGKSQTITNLLTRALAEGKRVLFVAEKRAALDVVRQRLDAVGIGPFSLDLHDKGSKPTVVRAQIKAALEHAVQPDQQGFAVQRESLQSARRSLARYAERLHEANPAGQSFYSARTASLALGADGPTLPVPRELLTGDAEARIAQLRHVLAELPDTADPARPSPDHPWRFVAASDPAAVDVDAARAVASEVDLAVAGLRPGRAAVVVAAATRAEDLELLASLLTGPGVPLAVLDETRTERWQQASTALAAEIAAFAAASQPGLELATPAAMELPLADIHTQAQAAAASSWFGRKKRLRAVLELLRPGLRAGADPAPKEVPALAAALLQVQSTVRGIADRGRTVPGLTIPATWNPLTDDGRQLVHQQLGWLRWAGGALSPDAAGAAGSAPSFAGELRRFLSDGAAVDQTERDGMQRLARAVRALASWSGGSAEAFSAWSGSFGLVGRWTATAERRDLGDPGLLSLRRWVALRGALEPLRAAGLVDAYESLLDGVVPAEEAVRALDRGVAATSIDERRRATGLDAFDPVAHGRAVDRFASSTRAVREHLETTVPAQVLAARPFQPDTGLGKVGALQRELAKQRRGLGVRALLGTYGELITQLMPCVLVSPDSVARFFPVGGALFDIVVFDEASQIRVADAVGAMGRSRSVVIVGDSKQMPPTSFAEPSTGTDDEAPEDLLIVEDEESILSECVQARVKRHWLSWHYRSKDESLIAFSNQHYYDGRLSSFPAPRSAEDDLDSPGIRMVRVDGVFQRTGRGRLLRTNVVEAEAVVAEIRRRFAASPDRFPSIGVVTFNQQQRAYIEGLLRDAGDDRLVEALDGGVGEGLFVKNLENVQGDERDVILFSTAFSVNERGMLPLNFGPLNRGGGERRLNVAITRARQQIIVFSSFEPSQLRAEETSSLGIKHLRAYLDLAAEGSGVLERGRSTLTRDRHVEDVATGLRARGWRVETEVGMSDFKIDCVVHGGGDGADEPVMAVLMDGPGWRGRRTVGDRDGLPVQVLSRLLAWPAVERVWMPDWLADPAAVLDGLELAAQAALASEGALESSAVPDVAPLPATNEPSPAADEIRAALSATGNGAAGQAYERGPEPAPAEASAAPVVGSEGLSATPADAAPEPSDARALPGETPYVPWRPTSIRSRLTLDSLPGQHAARRVAEVITEVVEAEGPLTTDRLARLVAGAFDLTKVSDARKQAILDQLPSGLAPQPDEPFVWPAALSPSTWTGFRRSSSLDTRPLEQVALREIGNAMVALCAASGGAYREELMRATLDVFGGERLTAAITTRLTAALELTVAEGRLRLEPGELYVLR